MLTKDCILSMHNYYEFYFIYRRLAENEKQNKELLAITTRKEEIIQQLQIKEEQYIEEMASLNRQLDTAKSDARKRLEEVKERSDSKERSQLAKMADIEAQLGRVNGQLAQTKRAKEEVYIYNVHAN